MTKLEIEAISALPNEYRIDGTKVALVSGVVRETPVAMHSTVQPLWF